MAETTDIEKTELFGIPLQELPTYRKAEPVKDKPVEYREEINFALLDEILKFIIEHPRQWEQAAWFRIVDRESGEMTYKSEIQIVEEQNSCGAAFCFAGHVALAAGFPAPPLNNHEEWTRQVTLDLEAVAPWDREYSEDVSEFAMKVLGLHNGQDDALFAGENTIGDLRAIVYALHKNSDIYGWQLRELVEDNNFDEDDTDEDIQDVVDAWLKDEDLLPKVAA